MNLRDWLRSWLDIEDQKEVIQFPVEVSCFVGDDEMDQVECEGYVRNGVLTVWFAGKLARVDRYVWFKPRGIDHLFRYSGVGPQLRGPASITAPEFSSHRTFHCHAKWSGHNVILVYAKPFIRKDKITYAEERLVTKDDPYPMDYGLKGSFTIPIP